MERATRSHRGASSGCVSASKAPNAHLRARAERAHGGVTLAAMRSRFFALLVLVAGCAPAPKPVTAPPPPPAAPPPPEVKQTELHAGVTALALECTAGTAEVCNAVDDNCDGVVDEGCPYAA